MKKNIVILLSALVLFCGCKKGFMDRFPLDQVSDQNFWKTEQDLELYCNNFYATYITGFGYDFGDATIQPYGYTQAAIAYGDVITDNGAPNTYSRVAANQYVAYVSGGSGSGGWNFTNIRSLNFFLDNYQRAPVSDDVRNRYAAEIYFFKAYDYFEKVKLFGDVPWLSHALQINSPELTAPRTPRAEVMDSVLSLLNTAIANLPEKGSEKSGRLNKDVAQFLKARVCLYEGTYRKYHTELNLDGTPFLHEAINACENLMSKTYKLYTTGNPDKDYNALFAQYTYATNPEIVLWKQYSADENLGVAFSRYYAQNLRHQHGATRALVDEYLCTDGKSISASPLFMGHDSIQREMLNRDPRLPQTICNFGEYLLNSAVMGANNGRLPNIPGLTGNKCPTGFRVAKWFLNDPVDWDRVTLGMQAAPVYRYAEILLDYAEAKFEVGECTQEVVDNTINLIRARVNMPGLNVTDITPDPVLDNLYSTYCGYVPAPLLREIRRERRVEFAFENLRWDDLMRWKMGRFLEIPVEGIKFVQSQFPTVKIDKDVFLSPEGYIMPYKQTLPTGRTFDEGKEYLFPIPFEDLVLNKNLVQNPGWDKP